MNPIESCYENTVDRRTISQLRYQMPRVDRYRVSREDVLRFAGRHTDAELLQWRNVGPKTVAWIRAELARLPQAPIVASVMSSEESFY